MRRIRWMFMTAFLWRGKSTWPPYGGRLESWIGSGCPVFATGYLDFCTPASPRGAACAATTLKANHLCRFVIRPGAARRHGFCRRVDRHQDRADLGGGVLQECPLRAVRRPDAYPAALVGAQPEQPAGQGQHVAVQFRIGPAPSSGRADEQAQRAYACGMALSLDLAPGGVPPGT